MIFGIWPGVVQADLVSFEPVGCAPEDPEATLAALRGLQGDAETFYVRAYRHYGPGAPEYANSVEPSPADPGRYAGEGRRIDLVCSYQAQAPDPDGFARFVREAVSDLHGWGGGKLQVCEELDMAAPLDGGSPGCFDALHAGLDAAFAERDRLGADVLVGVNAAGMADADFWDRMTGAMGPRLTSRLDYIGLDFFPDVFRPLPAEQLAAATAYMVTTFREVTGAAGIDPATPIHITETGWPTGPGRDERTQARVMTAVARAVIDAGAGVDAYEIFGLRDGLTSGAWSQRFGLLRDDYTPKPAYHEIQRLIARASRPLCRTRSSREDETPTREDAHGRAAAEPDAGTPHAADR